MSAPATRPVVVPRPYQERVDSRLAKSLDIAPSLVVAPTGSGKSLMIAMAAARGVGETGTALVLHHREELVSQNREELRGHAPKIKIGTWDASQRWFPRPGVTFAMTQTLTGPGSLGLMPPVDLLLVDECHLYMAPTFKRILDRAKILNPDVKIAGFTATPFRADKKGLGTLFPRVADIITIGELVANNWLVPPTAKVLDVGINDKIENVRKTSGGEYDLDEVAELMNVAIVNGAVVRAWKEHAHDKHTIVFCATVEHSKAMAEAFTAAGVRARSVDGTTNKATRKAMLAAFDRREFQVLCNVGVATTGFNVQHVDCVVLTRPSSFKSTLIQMIGRGLRVIDPRKYPHLKPKSDCLVLDFGRSLRKYGGNLAELIDLDGKHEDEAKTGGLLRVCPACKAQIPLRARECPLCGAQMSAPPKKDPIIVDTTKMKPLELILDASPFRWVDINPLTMAASGMSAWVAVFLSPREETWSCFGGRSEGGRAAPPELLQRGTKAQCVRAGDDFLRLYGDLQSAGKKRDWLGRQPSDRQLSLLGGGAREGDDRYTASCRITLAHAKAAIREILLKERADDEKFGT